MEEVIDIVDENNQPTGEGRPRSVVHADGLWHRTVHIYLFRKQGTEIEFLTHLRSAKKDLHPNAWDTRFGGHIKSGSDIQQTTINELKDELGLDLDFNALIEGNWRKCDHYPNREFAQVFYLEFNGDINDLRFQDDEVQEARWMTTKDIEKSMADNPEQWSGGIDGFREVMSTLTEKL
ncbi:hypothetical protein A2V68_02380 [candidate division Kazan bacterium RBG_13_50_9]|uniref:Nudix hydrolase domain-containing protein n=1 Tax=candidate division Kazan bacterium RBG_13_50_9 TaxID=1798535 RepID=A0A1F4NS28_UNCK3|nr:MAG: hypothetical protein A2V68_02380 [candidate division Kazan bacterium RBG_13_50_9]